MVLENLPFDIKKHPGIAALLIGFAYLSLGIILGRWKFAPYSGLFAVFFTVIAALPFFYSTIKKEESYDVAHTDERSILKSHSKLFKISLFFFLGVLFASALFGIIMPSDAVSSFFGAQTDAISQINPSLSGKAVSKGEAFFSIFSHNMEILILCVLFSFLYGVGALFILTWNASVVGIAMANFIKIKLAMGGFYFVAILQGFLRFLVHGLPEMLAFIVAGFAGGIISVAVIKHHIFSKKSHTILKDSTILILIAVGLLLIAALIEVFVTPLLI